MIPNYLGPGQNLDPKSHTILPPYEFFWGPNFFGTKIFFGTNTFFGTKIFFKTKFFFGEKFFLTKLFWRNFFRSNLFSDQIFFSTKISFGPKLFMNKIFLSDLIFFLLTFHSFCIKENLLSNMNNSINFNWSWILPSSV